MTIITIAIAQRSSESSSLRVRLNRTNLPAGRQGNPAQDYLHLFYTFMIGFILDKYVTTIKRDPSTTPPWLADKLRITIEIKL
jgi:hypothetical protein